MTGLDAKRKLHSKGMTIRSWAAKHGYRYNLVSDVIRGINKGTYGKGYEVAKKLGLSQKEAL